MKTNQEQLDEVWAEYNLEWSRLDKKCGDAITPVKESYYEACASITKVHEDLIRHIGEIRDAKLEKITDEDLIIIDGKRYRLEE